LDVIDERYFLFRGMNPGEEKKNLIYKRIFEVLLYIPIVDSMYQYEISNCKLIFLTKRKDLLKIFQRKGFLRE
jgi:hypothetical protein